MVVIAIIWTSKLGNCQYWNLFCNSKTLKAVVLPAAMLELDRLVLRALRPPAAWGVICCGTTDSTHYGKQMTPEMTVYCVNAVKCSC